jgi:hypothetical protein
MPIYHVRLEDPDSSAYRAVTISIDGSEEDAVAYLEEKERDYCAFQADLDAIASATNGVKDAAALKKLDREGVIEKLSGRDKAHVFLDRQKKPYQVVSVEKVGDPDNSEALKALARKRKAAGA